VAARCRRHPREVEHRHLRSSRPASAGRLRPWRTSSPTPYERSSAASEVSLARFGLRIIRAMQPSTARGKAAECLAGARPALAPPDRASPRRSRLDSLADCGMWQSGSVRARRSSWLSQASVCGASSRPGVLVRRSPLWRLLLLAEQERAVVWVAVGGRSGATQTPAVWPVDYEAFRCGLREAWFDGRCSLRLSMLPTGGAI
jgi:hypothetical protein